ncbi:MAG: flagellar motor protein MotB [Sedimentisphaerales bacterium]|nr:flagellar motor protein MotB [Sedimentisphaerales bacterium]
MAKKKKKAPEGAPDWMVTYGDMMTLLFCFFVILVSMSEIKSDQKFMDVMESIKRAFGYRGGIGWVPGEATPNNTHDRKMSELIMRKFQLQKGKTVEEGIEGANPSVRDIREGQEYTLGGRISFEPGKAKLLETAKVHLAEFAEVVRGMNTRIRVRGHAARKSLDQIKPFQSLDELSFARAMAVKNFLVEQGIREERITVEACGDNEPLVAQAYNEAGRAKNRRVSIIVTETLVEQYQGKPLTDDDEKIF